MNYTTPYSSKGKITVWLIRMLYWLFSWVIPNKKEPKIFEENPRTMTPADLLYFGYKYYFQPPLKAKSGSNLEQHFKNQKISFRNNKSVKQKAIIALGGDLMPYKLVRNSDANELWEETGDLFFDADLTFANLETPIDTKQNPSFVPEVMLHHMLFNGDEKLFDIFNGNRVKGMDIVSVANNHSLDMGQKGLTNTLSFLKKKGIPYVGAAMSEEESQTPNIIERNGIKFGFIAYTYSLNEFALPIDKPWMVNVLPLNTQDCNINPIVNQAKQLRQAGADIIVCSLHAGNAYQPYPSPVTVKLYHRIIEETGIDIIAGSHPHNLQPMEVIQYKSKVTGEEKKCFAIYSLSDFVAWDIFLWCHLSAIVRIEVAKENEITFINNVSVDPVYMQLINKERLKMRILTEGNLHNIVSDKRSKNEMKVLMSYYKQFFLPENF